MCVCFEDFANVVLDNDMLYSDEEGLSVFEAEHCQKTSVKQKENTLNFNRQVYFRDIRTLISLISSHSCID